MMKILFIAPIFFEYEIQIKKALEARYDKVIFRSEVPFNSNVKYYALRRFSASFARISLKYYNKELVRIVQCEKIDRIFIIRGYGLNELFLKSVKAFENSVEIFHYQWDSLQNNPNGKMISCYADHNFSFDLEDIRTYNQFTHLPLFYTWDALPDRPSPDSFKQDIDILFIGFYHSSRHKIVDKLKEACRDNGLKVNSHIYLPLWSYLRDRLTNKEINRNDISFKKISRKHYYELLCRSRIVLDIQSTTQTGATIRTFETLSLSRKLLSTNITIKEEKFYSPINVKIWNPSDELNMEELLSADFDHSKDSFIRNVSDWLNVIGV